MIVNTEGSSKPQNSNLCFVVTMRVKFKSYLPLYIVHNVRILNFTYKVSHHRNKSPMNLIRCHRWNCCFRNLSHHSQSHGCEINFFENPSAQSIPANAMMATHRSHRWSIAEETPRRAENLNVIWRGDRRVTRPGPRHRVVYHAPRRNVLPL